MEILVIGDSWAAAREADTGRDAGWPALMGIAAGHRQGLSGSTAAQWAGDEGGVLTRARRTSAEAVVVSLLGNDARIAVLEGRVTADSVVRGINNLRTVLDALEHPLTVVMLYADPFGGRNEQANVAVPMLNGIIRMACVGRSVIFADTSAWLTPDHFDGRDIHPTRAGHAAIAHQMHQLCEGGG
ncbi:MAG: SGNH/GDSL hydrolase family protein [Gammaproteobacteria bacterium]|nr:SGNH/GDSL hydrolase family protein [Gammaproteobacteria bacterium]